MISLPSEGSIRMRDRAASAEATVASRTLLGCSQSAGKMPAAAPIDWEQAR